MAIVVAEYLGQRVDSDTHVRPYPHHEKVGVGIQFEEKGECPFNGLPCKKMDKKKNAKFPVCSLRRNGELYIICEHRLISSSRKPELPLSPYQSKMLLILARELFSPEVTHSQLLYKTEVYMVPDNTDAVEEESKRASFGRADYMLCIPPNVISTYGPRKLIVEMQGGGETSDTGNMTERLKEWTNLELPNLEFPNNELLSLPLGVGLIQTNAWRRLQEQILTKGSVAVASGYGFAACVGTHLFNQVEEKLGGFADLRLSKKNDKWDTVLIPYCEDELGTETIIENAIPLKINYDRIVYTTYKTLAQKLIERGTSIQKAFGEKWWKLSGEAVGEDGMPLETTKSRRSKVNLVNSRNIS